MYQVALCDDELEELEKAEKLLSAYEKAHPGLQFMARYFESADELIYEFKEGNYMPDLVFMDIYMPCGKRNLYPLGIKAAKQLRNMNYQGKLIFLTTSQDYALEAFDVEATQYVVKPVSKNKWFSLMNNVVEELEKERKKYVLLSVERKLMKVPVNDIVYCEAQGKTQCMHLKSGAQYTLHMTMLEIYELLSPYQEFVKLGVSFIVNLGYVASLNAKEIHMDNGIRVYVPRGTYKSLREKYFQYYCRGSSEFSLDGGAINEKNLGIF